MIKPSVGRVVWYHPSLDDKNVALGGDQPFAALIAHVWNDTCVNLAIFDANGVSFSKTSVQLVQDETEEKSSNGYAEWMPYQVGQAKKHEVPHTNAFMRD